MTLESDVSWSQLGAARDSWHETGVWRDLLCETPLLAAHSRFQVCRLCGQCWKSFDVWDPDQAGHARCFSSQWKLGADPLVYGTGFCLHPCRMALTWSPVIIFAGMVRHVTEHVFLHPLEDLPGELDVLYEGRKQRTRADERGGTSQRIVSTTKWTETP